MTVHLGVRCERDGCKAHLWRTSQPGEAIADLARRLHHDARRDGWRSPDDVDVCPEHAAAAAA